MIRHAGIKDYDRIMELMIEFANSAPIDVFQDPDYDYRRVQHFLTKIQKQGCILVAEDKSGVVQGMLIALIFEDLWLPHIKVLKELAWWVEPEHRQSSMGYKLLLEYIKVGKTMRDNSVIDNFTLTNMMISPDFDLQKRGWTPIETNYVYEGK